MSDEIPIEGWVLVEAERAIRAVRSDLQSYYADLNAVDSANVRRAHDIIMMTLAGREKQNESIEQQPTHTVMARIIGLKRMRPIHGPESAMATVQVFEPGGDLTTIEIPVTGIMGQLDSLGAIYRVEIKFVPMG